VIRRHLALVALLAGCGDVPPFECNVDSDCNTGGVCTNDGFCAFADQSCPTTALRYDASAGELGGQCVSPDTAVAGDTADNPIQLADTRNADITGARDDITPSCGDPGGRDIFFELALDMKTRLSLDTLGTTFAVHLAVFEGACAQLGTELACDEVSCNPRQKLFSRILDAGTYCVVADENTQFPNDGTELVVRADIGQPSAPGCFGAR
jgi:hypothetical protein